MGSFRYQIATAKGEDKPDWTPGKSTFDAGWDVARDRLRFHRGEGFTITERPQPPGQVRRLSEIDEHLGPRMRNADPGTVFAIRSQADRFTVLMRRVEEPLDNGAELIKLGKTKIGCRYDLGAAGPDVFDCSGYTQWLHWTLTGL